MPVNSTFWGPIKMRLRRPREWAFTQPVWWSMPTLT